MTVICLKHTNNTINSNCQLHCQHGFQNYQKDQINDLVLQPQGWRTKSFYLSPSSKEKLVFWTQGKMEVSWTHGGHVKMKIICKMSVNHLFTCLLSCVFITFHMFYLPYPHSIVQYLPTCVFLMSSSCCCTTSLYLISSMFLPHVFLTFTTCYLVYLQVDYGLVP